MQFNKKSEILCVKNLKVAIFTLSIQKYSKIVFITTFNFNLTLIKNHSNYYLKLIQSSFYLSIQMSFYTKKRNQG